VTQQEIDDIISKIDADGSEEIDYLEWLVSTIDKKSLLSDEKLEACFNHFDKD